MYYKLTNPCPDQYTSRYNRTCAVSVLHISPAQLAFEDFHDDTLLYYYRKYHSWHGDIESWDDIYDDDGSRSLPNK